MDPARGGCLLQWRAGRQRELQHRHHRGRTGRRCTRVFTFENNYPNPFNPATTFRFALPERADVELMIYNVKGQLVTRLVNEALDAGSHQVRWNAGSLPSGTYFVRLTAGKFTSTPESDVVVE
ncbi:MAG: T9SS type A sorting domain-containing protein [Calditrichae bacterium]|nr:T9SS type A sorting domain-containing protein [Calditrichia bacterium]